MREHKQRVQVAFATREQAERYGVKLAEQGVHYAINFAGSYFVKTEPLSSAARLALPDYRTIRKTLEAAPARRRISLNVYFDQEDNSDHNAIAFETIRFALRKFAGDYVTEDWSLSEGFGGVEADKVIDWWTRPAAKA